MFSKLGTERAISGLCALYNVPSVTEHSIDEVNSWSARLANAVDSKRQPTRSLDSEETAFIINELILTKSSFEYWATRYAKVNIGGSALSNLYPLLESQQLVLHYLAKLETQTLLGERSEGLLVNILKGPRQVGISTLSEVILAYKSTTQNNIFGLIASDVPESSSKLFDMYERLVDNLPWWLRPQIIERVKDTEIKFDGDSNIWVGAGKSVRGTTGQRGQLGRGTTLSAIHLSELATWDNPDQIDDALLPTVPYDVRSFALFESTAKGQNNWWHKQWRMTKKGIGRFTNIFIPWYIISKYAQPYPANWIPKDSTLSAANRVEESSLRLLHTKVTISKEQLYWYEKTRETYESKSKLTNFLEEYGAFEDEECFQISGRSIFTAETIQRITEQAKRPLAICDILHRSEIKEAITNLVEVPAGFAVHPLSAPERRSLELSEDPLEATLGKLLIWELPRPSKRYVMSADIGDGIGQDRSCLEITRVGDLHEPDEQVAQFVSNDIDPIGFAAILDTVGRLYRDSEGIEALAAIENNNHGLATQSELQNHFGYQNFFIWQKLDSADPAASNTRAIGWLTTRRTRPLIITRYVRKVRYIDPDSNQADYLINSPHTIAELRTFTTDTSVAEAASDPSNPNAHDDTIMAAAIGIHVAQTLHFEETEDLDTQRRRKSEELRNKQALAARQSSQRGWHNTDCTVDEINSGFASSGFSSEGLDTLNKLAEH